MNFRCGVALECSTIAFTSLFALFVHSALDRRFGWSQMPPLVSWMGDALLVLSFIMFYFVFRMTVAK